MVKRLGRLLLPAIGCLALFTLARQARLTGWDEAFYLAQLTSVVADRDLTLQDDLLAIPNDLPLRLRTVTLVHESGALRNSFSIGPAWLHSAYAVALPTRSSDAFRAAFSIASMFLLVFTVLFTQRLVRDFGVSPMLAAGCSAAAVLWGPLAVYGTRASLSAHLPSAFWASLLLLAGRRWGDRGRIRHALIAGVAGGALTITRWQDLVLVGVVASSAAILAISSRQGRGTRVAGLLAAGLAAALVGLVQPLALMRQFGTWIDLPQGAGFMHWGEPAIGSFLFSPVHGLFTWTPVFGVGLLGLLLAPAGAPRWVKVAVAMLTLGVALSVYVSAAADDWWAGSAFGPRRLASLTPVAALGLSFVAVRVSPAVRGIVALGATTWAAFALSAFYSGYEDISTALSGRPSADAALLGPVRGWIGWQDPWGPLYAAKPGFTLRDAPGNADRVVGLAIVVCVCLVAAALWRASRTHLVQRALVVAALAWAALWLLVLARMPGNGEVNASWRAILEGESPAAGVPDSLRGPAEVVRAVCTTLGGDADTGTAILFRAKERGVAGIAVSEMIGLRSNPVRVRFALGDRSVERVCGIGSLPSPSGS